MAWYYNATTGETKALDTDLYAAWLDKGNHKALAYTLIPDPPAPGAWYDGTQWQVYEPTLEQRRAGMACTPRQARLALHQSGLLTAVEDYVADSTDLALKIEWAFAIEIRRTWPPVAAFAQANEISDADLDALFELAATL